MKTRKRYIIIGGIIAIVTVFAGLAVAGAGCARHFGPYGPGFHRFGGEMHGFVLKRLDSKVKELDLTPVQKTKYDALRARLEEQLQAAREDRRKSGVVLRAELAKQSPDMAALTAGMKEKIDAVSGALRTDLDLFSSFYSALDEAQKQKLIAGMRKRMAAADACREEWR